MPAQLELAEEVAAVAANPEAAQAVFRAGARLVEEGLGLFEPAAANIQVKSAAGAIERLSAAQFEQRFGVKYLSQLTISPDCPIDPLAKLPKEPVWSPTSSTQRKSLEYDVGRGLRNGFGDSQLHGDGERKSWLYGDQIKRGGLANMYISKIDDVVGHGVFAGEKITPGTMLGEYTGQARPYLGDIEKNNPYIFGYGPGATVDAREMGNVTRFINHSQTHPNAAEAKVVVDDVPHIILVATKTIEKDAQVLFDYGPGYWQERTAQVLDKIGK